MMVEQQTQQNSAPATVKNNVTIKQELNHTTPTPPPATTDTKPISDAVIKTEKVADRAVWSGMWGMSEAAFKPNGVISSFEMKSQEDVAIPMCGGGDDSVHPAMSGSALARSSKTMNAPVNQVTPVREGQTPDSSGERRGDSIRARRYQPVAVRGFRLWENRFGVFTLHGFLDKEMNELRLYKVYKPKEPVKRTLPRRSRSARAATPAIKREVKALSISAPGVAAITASVDVTKIVTPQARPTIVAPRSVGTPMSDYLSPSLVLGRSERKRSIPAHLREDNILDWIKPDEHEEPMDLGTIRNNLETGFYDSPSDFAEHVRLTFRNAMLYNAAHSQVHIYARKLVDDFEKRFKSLNLKLSTKNKHPDMKKKDRKADGSYSSKKIRGGKGTKGNTKRQMSGEDNGLIMSLKEDIERLKATLEQLQPSMAKAVASKSAKAAKYVVVFYYQVYHWMSTLTGCLIHLSASFRPFKMDDLTEEELNEPMSQMDKARLSSDIKLLPQDKINRVLQIIAEAVPVAKLANENDEVELDINAFDTRCLRMLEGYVRFGASSCGEPRGLEHACQEETPNGTPLPQSNGGSQSTSSLWLSARSMEQIKQQKIQQKEKERSDELEAQKRREIEMREKEKEREQTERRKQEQEQAAKLAEEKRLREERAREAERARQVQLAMEREKLARDDDVELHDATLSEDLDAFSSSSFLNRFQRFFTGVLSVQTTILSLFCAHVILMQALQELQKEKHERLAAKSRNSVVDIAGVEGLNAIAMEPRVASPTRASTELKSDMLLEDVHFAMQKLKREMAELKTTNSKLLLTNSQLEDDLAHLQAKFDEEKRAHVNGKKWFLPKIQKMEEQMLNTIKAFEEVKLSVELMTNMYKVRQMTPSEATNDTLSSAKASIVQLQGEVRATAQVAAAKEVELLAAFEKQQAVLQQKLDKTKRELMESVAEMLSLDSRLRKAQEKLTKQATDGTSA
ncbi:NET domain [Phytophthora cactorum]|nr:NET domain [Phytophthora cactorum]